jgi:MFS transporter, PHS family, inorganic phosphate transporter
MGQLWYVSSPFGPPGTNITEWPAAALVSLVVVSAYKNQLLRETEFHLVSVDYMWRLLIGLGCVPAVVALYFRLTIPETPRFTMDIERNLDQASADIANNIINEDTDYDPDNIRRVVTPKASWGDFTKHFGQWKNFKILFGTSWSWFALDIAFYGLGLNSSIILQGIGFGGATSKGVLGIYQTLWNVSVGNLILSAAGLIPGYWVAFLLIDSWGRKPIQLMGFIVLSALFIVMGVSQCHLERRSN